MRAFMYGVRAIEGLFGTRVCLLLVLVFVISIDRFNPSDASPESKNDTLSFLKPGNLTKEQLNSVVTMEFNFKHVDRKNRTAVNAAYREVRRKILEYLNRRKSTTIYTTTTASYTTTAVTTTTIFTTITPTFTTPTTLITTTTPTAQTTTSAAPTTTATTSVVETTTETTTTVAATTLTTPATTTTPIITTKSVTILRTVGPNRKRKRRRKRSQTTGGNDVIYTDEDLPFIENEPEIYENGILRISLFFNTTELGGIDLGELLHNTTNALNETGELKTAAGAPVVKIYRGLPPTPPVPMAQMADYRVWLPILLAIVLLLIIFIFVFSWKATNKKVKNDERKKIIPKLDSKPDSSNGHAPRILDDRDGWLIPYEQFSN